jgi:hypothetical protein
MAGRQLIGGATCVRPARSGKHHSCPAPLLKTLRNAPTPASLPGRGRSAFREVGVTRALPFSSAWRTGCVTCGRLTFGLMVRSGCHYRSSDTVWSPSGHTRPGQVETFPWPYCRMTGLPTTPLGIACHSKPGRGVLVQRPARASHEKTDRRSGECQHRRKHHLERAGGSFPSVRGSPEWHKGVSNTHQHGSDGKRDDQLETGCVPEATPPASVGLTVEIDDAHALIMPKIRTTCRQGWLDPPYVRGLCVLSPGPAAGGCRRSSSSRR